MLNLVRETFHDLGEFRHLTWLRCRLGLGLLSHAPHRAMASTGVQSEEIVRIAKKSSQRCGVKRFDPYPASTARKAGHRSPTETVHGRRDGDGKNASDILGETS